MSRIVQSLTFLLLFSNATHANFDSVTPSQCVEILRAQGVKPSHLVIGLRNFGGEYEATRHNAGFRVLKQLISSTQANRLGGYQFEKSLAFETVEEAREFLEWSGASIVSSQGREVTYRVGMELFRPTSDSSSPQIYFVGPLFDINESGEFIAPIARELGLSTDRILVLHDDLDLPVNEVRWKLGKPDNMKSDRHNGLRSMNQKFSEASYYRLRIGISHPKRAQSEMSVRDWVLSAAGESESEELDRLSDGPIRDAISLWANGKAHTIAGVIHSH